MINLCEIIKKRSCPAVFVFDMNGKVLFLNRVASEMCTESQDVEEPWNYDTLFVNSEILRLCEYFRKMESDYDDFAKCPEDIGNDTAIVNFNGRPHAVRVSHVWEPGREGTAEQIMVLVEGIIEKHEINYEKVKKDFGLSKREIEVLKHICKGLTTKEISAKTFLSEHTVRDHIKSIMQKIKVNSRVELLAFLK